MSEDDTADGDDDWFESALAADEDGDAADEDGNAVDEDGDAVDEGANIQPEGPGTVDEDADGEESGVSEAGAVAGDEPPGEGDGQGTTGDATPGFDPSDGMADESPFGDTGVESDDSFGTWGDEPAGPGGTGGEEALFDDSFEEAMGGTTTGGSGGDGDDYDDDALESDIPRLDVGIEGLDNMIQGGVPRRHLAVVIGGAGTGKTTFGLQFLQHGLTREEPEKSVFITLEQTYEDIMATANERGWEFERHEDEGNLAIVDLDPVEMANSLDNIRGELPELIEDFGADRFVLDSVSLLEMMYDEQARRRTEVFDFTQSLKEAGVTTVFTSEAAENNPYASRHGIIEYLTDAVFLLRYVRSETQETRLAVEIQKIRNANHSRETKPYDITLDGISVYEQANIF